MDSRDSTAAFGAAGEIDDQGFGGSTDSIGCPQGTGSYSVTRVTL